MNSKTNTVNTAVIARPAAVDRREPGPSFSVASPHLPSISVRIRLELQQDRSAYGLFIALVILSIWGLSLGFLLTRNLAHFSPLWLLIAIPWQTFLYTGLFITAHDAMHGAIYPQNPRLNHGIGTLAVLLYGLFSYRDLLAKHSLHHRYPASEMDPDFHDGQHGNLLVWYFNFMKSYWSWSRLLGVVLLFHSVHFLFPISDANLTLFWVIPSLLSSVQLFLFGTFLTHREPSTGYRNAHRAQSSGMPVWLSFLTCYHFGYHREHHEYPYLAWWQLPTVYQPDSPQPL